MKNLDYKIEDFILESLNISSFDMLYSSIKIWDTDYEDYYVVSVTVDNNVMGYLVYKNDFESEFKVMSAQEIEFFNRKELVYDNLHKLVSDVLDEIECDDVTDFDTFKVYSSSMDEDNKYIVFRVELTAEISGIILESIRLISYEHGEFETTDDDLTSTEHLLFDCYFPNNTGNRA